MGFLYFNYMAQISEKELEEYIFKNYNSIDKLEGNYITRQLNLQGYGILDLLIIEYYEQHFTFKVVELKQGIVNSKAFGQINRYITALERNLQEINFPNEEKFYSIEGHLIGQTLDLNDDSCYLQNNIYPEITVHEYSLDLSSGLKFNSIEGKWFSKQEKTNYSLEKMLKKAITNNKKIENICQNIDQ